MTQPILITGGTGFIGSHTVVTLAQAGQPVVILDNLCNSSAKVLDRLARLNASPIDFVQADIRDAAALDALFARYNFAGVIHFAGLKAVGESVAQPLRYLENNVSGTINLLQAMNRADVRRIVFS
jgi:UDP-glucose 4-epimerase